MKLAVKQPPLEKERAFFKVRGTHTAKAGPDQNHCL